MADSSVERAEYLLNLPSLADLETLPDKTATAAHAMSTAILAERVAAAVPIFQAALRKWLVRKSARLLAARGRS